MKVLKPGHEYALDMLDADNMHRLHFVNRNPGEESPGTTNQEVLRALIDRIQFLDSQLPWPGNGRILLHLRMALALHEARALERKIEAGTLKPENVPTGLDGHWILRM